MSKFVYLNVNDTKREEMDCVCRAITLASGLKYHTVEKLLQLVGEHNNCDPLTVHCYHYLLENVLGYQVKFADDYETVEDIINQYPNNTLIIRLEGHLLCVINSVIYDLFNSSDQLVDRYWIVT